MISGTGLLKRWCNKTERKSDSESDSDSDPHHGWSPLTALQRLLDAILKMR
jgi:hypothetical protein